MKIQHTSKTQFDIPSLGLSTDENGVVDVPDAAAGRPPEARIAEATAELIVAVETVDHERAQALRAEISGLDYGSGLLAQDVWQPYGPKAKAAVKQEDDK